MSLVHQIAHLLKAPPTVFVLLEDIGPMGNVLFVQQITTVLQARNNVHCVPQGLLHTQVQPRVHAAQENTGHRTSVEHVLQTPTAFQCRSHVLTALEVQTHLQGLDIATALLVTTGTLATATFVMLIHGVQRAL